MTLRVCLTSIEFFPEIQGGFGRATRAIGRALADRGVSVTVITPRRSSTGPDTFDLDGMTVRQFTPWNPWQAIRLYRDADADVYHSEDTSLGTRLAMTAMPARAHAITFRDPLDRHDWKIETLLSGHSKINFLKYRIGVDNVFVRRAVRRAKGLYVAAEFLGPKVAHKYALADMPRFLATPVSVPDRVTKAERPTVCFVGRFDPRKRPEMFFELAREFPDVDFIAVGESSDRKRQAMLTEMADKIPNLELTGAIDQFGSTLLAEILSKSWVIVNTSAREGLPTTFVEAAAHRCAILSFTNPDNFASRFGYNAAEGELSMGLMYLLQNDRWRSLGQSAYEFVAPVFGIDNSIQAHFDMYEATRQRSHTDS